jgi:NADH-quinone oxidoreductase subunit L
MLWPLRVLAVFSIIGGVIGVEAAFNNVFGGEDHAATFGEQLVAPFAHAPVAAIAGLGVLAMGWFAASKLYAGATADPLPAKLGSFSRAMRNRFYLDELYEATVIRLHETLSGIAAWIDRWIIEGFCIGLVRGGTDLAGRALRMTQSGNLQTYAFLFALGVALVLWLVVGR